VAAPAGGQAGVDQAMADVRARVASLGPGG
jgi:hypothetical protein